GNPTGACRDASETAESRSLGLFFDLLADVFDRLADLPARPTVTLLNVPGRLVHGAFVVQPFVAGEIASGLLQLALELVCLPVEFVAVHQSSFEPGLGWL